MAASAARLPFWLQILCFGCLVHRYLSDDANDGDPDNGAEHRKGSVTVDRIGDLTWGDDDHVEIYNAEFLLSRWVLERAPWNAYHSGLALVNNRTGAKILYDYCPKNVSSVMRMLVPEVNQEAPAWKAWLLGDVGIRWQNEAYVKFFDHWPKSYTNMVKLAVTNGKEANRFAEWVKDDFSQNHDTFDPLEVLLNNGTTIRSTMCHDFVTDSLWFLYRNGVEIKPADTVFRDHIIMYAEVAEPVPAKEPYYYAVRHRREFLRYMRLLQIFYKRIADQFTYGREALIINWKLGLPTYMRNKGVDLRLKISPPFLNYCYLPLAIPPAKHDLLGPQKLCALSMNASIANATVPIADVGVISPEGSLDRDEALLAVLLITLVAALGAGRNSKQPKKADKKKNKH